MYLDTTNRSLQLGFDANVTTTAIDISVGYEDKASERVTPGTVLLAKSTAVAAQILAAPPTPGVGQQGNTARRVTEINVCNQDSVTHKITISIYDSLVPAVYNIHEQSLNAGQNLHYNEYNGWAVL